MRGFRVGFLSCSSIAGWLPPRYGYGDDGFMWVQRCWGESVAWSCEPEVLKSRICEDSLENGETIVWISRTIPIVI